MEQPDMENGISLKQKSAAPQGPPQRLSVPVQQPPPPPFRQK